uniref:Uncharacterized protein n=1 Tax=Siphoviridae sp. ctnN38 TaxID=2826455 RepID=A0A8S5N7C0_9CAUD|nr:MAG TPA: hypothetical protein [Siphoviridae sp. ctnN38]DAU15008.1 MAG TPA: hypothetical protein [Caudoviricetes sp.]
MFPVCSTAIEPFSKPPVFLLALLVYCNYMLVNIICQ